MTLREDERPTRRSVLALLGLGAAAMVAGCETVPHGRGFLANLPDAPGRDDEAPRGLAPDNESYAPPRELPNPPKPHVASGFRLPSDPNQPIARAAWTTQGPNARTIEPMNGVKLLTFHHAGDPKPFYGQTPAETAEHLEAIRRYHRSHGFQDIGYHFAIDRLGYVWQLRSLRYEGQHVRYHNPHNIGVVLLGNFDLQEPTQAQKQRAITFGSILRKAYRLPMKEVYTHQELVSTRCPGKALQPYMVYIRKRGLI